MELDEAVPTENELGPTIVLEDTEPLPNIVIGSESWHGQVPEVSEKRHKISRILLYYQHFYVVNLKMFWYTVVDFSDLHNYFYSFCLPNYNKCIFLFQCCTLFFPHFYYLS